MKNKYNIPKIRQEKEILPSAVALIKDQRDKENNNFNISFKYYNDGQCEVYGLEKNIARQMLNDFKMIGRSNRKTLYSNGIRQNPVFCAGAYKSLFSTIDPDTELKEHIIQSTARLFYFISGTIFNVIAIKNNHIETNKHRR